MVAVAQLSPVSRVRHRRPAIRQPALRPRPGVSIYEASTQGRTLIGHARVDLYCSGGDICGEADTALAKTIRTLTGCEAVLCSKIGYEPWGLLEAAGIAPNGEHAMEPIEEAVAAVYREMAGDGRLDKPAAAELRMSA